MSTKSKARARRRWHLQTTYWGTFAIDRMPKVTLAEVVRDVAEFRLRTLPNITLDDVPRQRLVMSPREFAMVEQLVDDDPRLKGTI